MALTLVPEQFITNSKVYLGLRSAFWRMKYNNDRVSIRSVVDQLWHIALLIEDGDLSDAEKRLRQAQDKLAQALKNGASNEEINKLLDEPSNCLSPIYAIYGKK